MDGDGLVDGEEGLATTGPAEADVAIALEPEPRGHPLDLRLAVVGDDAEVVAGPVRHALGQAQLEGARGELRARGPLVAGAPPAGRGGAAAPPGGSRRRGSPARREPPRRCRGARGAPGPPRPARCRARLPPSTTAAGTTSGTGRRNRRGHRPRRADGCGGRRARRAWRRSGAAPPGTSRPSPGCRTRTPCSGRRPAS